MNNNWRPFYQKEAECYHEKRYHSWYGRVFVEIYYQVLNGFVSENSDAMILDIASGTGHNLPILSRKGTFVVASDITIEMLKDSRKRFGNALQTQYTVNNAFELPFRDNSFDIVTSARFLHLFSLKEQKELIDEMTRVLKPGGMLIIDFYNKYHWAILYPVIFLYRMIKRKRPANDTRNTITQVEKWLLSPSLKKIDSIGIGSYFLVLLRCLGEKNGIRMSHIFRKGCLANLSDQFLVAAKKVQ
jgi:SAM-dependent methyltransferase